MKCYAGTLLAINLFITTALMAQQDSSVTNSAVKPGISHRDSVYLSGLNASGALMIFGGVGLCGAGSYLIYEGSKIYSSAPGPTSTNPSGDVTRNHQQGTAYMVAGGVAIAGGFVLGAFGVRNRLEFNRRKSRLLLQTGLLDSGNLGACLTY